MGYPVGRCRTLSPWLAALAITSGACAGGSGSGLPLPIASPVPASAAARDSARVASARKPARVAQRKPVAKKPVAKAPVAKAPVSKGKPSVVRPKVDSMAMEFAVMARLAHGPLTRAIARRTRNPELAERAAWAVTREAGRLRMSPSLLAAVLLIENRQLDSAAVSSAGAIGLMQVMPLHAGSYGCASSDLRTVDANICHGARILHLYMARSRSVTVALKRYNGCVRGTNTPRCDRYPLRVLQTAARLRRDILVGAAPVTPKAG